jgi:oligoendopeptidase F
MEYTAAIAKLPRKFLPAEYKITDWQSLEPYFQELLERPINSSTDLQAWLQDISELDA